MQREQMNIVVVGHVDHGKSTVIGRLLADTGSLPEGKLEQVKASCLRNAKPFEYAFLLDALKDEQAQGITIDTARCFFKTAKRDYIIIDAPGHVEFLKNMVSGAARAEAALLVIDAHEGIKENSKRHGYLLSMLGIKQVVVLINKMDLVQYSQEVYNRVRTEFSEFLKQLNVNPTEYIPICSRDGDNLITLSPNMPWYKGNPLLTHIDQFVKEADTNEKPFRMPVQDVYKFTEEGDDRRIIAGTILTGSISVNDEVVFFPSGKKSKIVTIEGFNTNKRTSIDAGYATGFTLQDELYLPAGEVMCKGGERKPLVNNRLKVNIFWMSRAPMILNKKYKLKIATTQVTVRLAKILSCIDASELSKIDGKDCIDRHDVAECVLETTRPISFDKIDFIQTLGRFVIVDNYDIAGGGIIISPAEQEDNLVMGQIKKREAEWVYGYINNSQREILFGHKSKFVLITGTNSTTIAKELELALFTKRVATYFLAFSNLQEGLDADVKGNSIDSEEQIRRLGELARIITGAGMIFISTLEQADEFDIKILNHLTAPHEFLHVKLGENSNQGGLNLLNLSSSYDQKLIINKILDHLKLQEIIPDFEI